MAFFDSSEGRILGALALSVVLHSAIAAGVTRLKSRHVEKDNTVTVAIVEVPPPPPPKVEEKKPEPPPPPRPPPKIARAPKIPVAPPMVQPKTVVPPPPQVAPPPPTVEAKNPTPNAVIETGITLESTSDKGGMTVAVGNTLYGTPNTTAKDPASIKPYKAARYAPIATVTEMPSIRERPDLRQYYPEEARRKDFEGDVVLRVVIDDDGTVVKADIVSDPGEGLGPAGVRAVMGKRIFNPARTNGIAVATTISNFVLRFQLN